MSKKETAPVVQETTGGPRPISEAVQSLSKLLDDDISGDASSGIITEKENENGTSFERHLPEELTPDLVDKVDDYRSDFASAASLSIGRLSNRLMGENKKLDSTTASMSLGGKNVVRVGVERKREYPVPGDGGTVTKFGVVTTKLDFVAGHNSGDLKKARDAVAEEALSMFGSKKK